MFTLWAFQESQMWSSPADCSYTRFCGQAHLCAKLLEEPLLPPCPSHPSLVKGLGAGWLRPHLQPHPLPLGPPTFSTLACNPSTVPCLSCTPSEKWKDTKYLINVKLTAEPHLPKARCSVVIHGPCQHALPDPSLLLLGHVEISAPTGRELHSLCLCGFGGTREAAGLAPLLFNLRERLQACRKQTEEVRWGVSEFMEMVLWLLGQCQLWFFTEGQCVVPAWPLPRVLSRCGTAETILTLSTQECPGYQVAETVDSSPSCIQYNTK